ncbi:putative permease [Archangium gephyra]|uniref:Permease n=1 Tax=Archangium gephyra TaxID=48 RepID=A0AAC8TEU1_9BACT|nr:ABC transporter permease [Archangium gephyra]AKJ03282.1 Permease [Archangium gephyra]REG22850.1 putative permease [Archangium gephyra]
MDTLSQDFWLALRKLRKSPGFTLIAVLTLALGMGANSAIFSVVDAVLLRPLPMPESERLVHVYSVSRGRNGDTSALDFRDMREKSRSFKELAVADSTDLSLTGAGGEPERLQGTTVSAEFFQLLGTPPLVGRTFLPGEDAPGHSRVVVLGHALWQRRFGGNPEVLGKSLEVGGVPYTVVGVMRPGFDFPSRSQLWIPLTWEGDVIDASNRGAHWLDVYGRLAPGVTVEQAQAELVALTRELEAQYPRTNTGFSAAVVSLQQSLVGEVEPALLLLLGAVGLVLLIACANLSNLLLARAVSREGEISVRLALGATPGRIVRQLLVESFVLALIGGAAGLLVASWGLDVLVALGPRDIPRLEQVTINGKVLAFSTGLSLLTAVLFGLFPALQAARAELGHSLREVGRSSTGVRHRARNVLVVSETALAVVLLVAAGLLLKSFMRLQQVDPGFRSDQVLTMDLALPESTYTFGGPATGQFYDTLLERVRALPGVQSAAATFHLPMAGRNVTTSMRDLSRPEPTPEQRQLAQVRFVTPGFFEVMRVPLKRGRLLTTQDGEQGQRAVLISEEAARRYWPGEDPLGRTIEIGMSFGNGEMGGQVVGVVGNVRHQGMATEPFPEVYIPFGQARANNMSLVVRTAGEPLALASSVRAEVHALDKNLPVAHVRTLENILGDAVAQPRFLMALVATFAGLALVLAAMGLYGVVTFAVSQRTRELGIRMALGADARSVLRLVIGQYLQLTAAGVALGLALAFVASRLLAGLLYSVQAADPWAYAGVTVLLVGVAFVASFLPAYRATRIDPVIALKHD